MASRSWFRSKLGPATLLAAGILAGCRMTPAPKPPVPPPPPKPIVRQGDEIVVAGKFFPTDTTVILWTDVRGYNAYAAKIANHGRRALDGNKPEDRAPSLADLQRNVDQLVLHYDECGLSKLCFDILQKRSLSTHFLLDVDGTVYQTLDLQERAWHATTANDRSIGIEIANIGALPPGETRKLTDWYRRDKAGQISLHPPPDAGDPRLFTPNFTARPARDTLVRGQVQGHELNQYDFTPEQYAALIKLTAALSRVFPQLRLDYPRDAAGRLVGQKLSDAELEKYRGVLGHFHIQENKVDPGPALQWDRLIDGARRLLEPPVTAPAPPSGQKRGRP